MEKNLIKQIPHSKPSISGKEIMSMTECLRIGSIAKGRYNKEFENQFSTYIGQEYVFLASSGTNAFFQILAALEISVNDEIVIPDYICDTLLFPIRFFKAIAVPYDNSKNSWNSDISEITNKITSKTRLIIINHTFGIPAEFVFNLKKNIPENIAIVEDCCHLITRNQKIGNLEIGKYSLCAFYSFHATKLLTLGEGGAIATDDSYFAKKLMQLEIGCNLSDFTCYLGLTQLSQYDYFLEKRLEISYLYKQKINFPASVKIVDGESIFFRFPVMFKEPIDLWHSNKVAYRRGIDSLLAFKLNIQPSINAFYVLRRTISIPIYPTLSKKEVEIIIEETNKLLNESYTSK